MGTLSSDRREIRMTQTAGLSAAPAVTVVRSPATTEPRWVRIVLLSVAALFLTLFYLFRWPPCLLKRWPKAGKCIWNPWWSRMPYRRYV
jgi:type II secretory pathway component PulM